MSSVESLADGLHLNLVPSLKLLFPAPQFSLVNTKTLVSWQATNVVCVDLTNFFFLFAEIWYAPLKVSNYVPSHHLFIWVPLYSAQVYSHVKSSCFTYRVKGFKSLQMHLVGDGTKH